MYSLVVEVPETGPTTSGGEPSQSGELPPDDQESNSVEFSMGNPRVEHINGVIHLYRDVDSTTDDAQTMTSSRVCVLAVPADVGVQEFCLFCGPYLKLIKDMRFLRRDKGRNTVYMAYLQFEKVETAESFVADYNGQPFSSLETDVVWKLVFVRDIEFQCGTPPPRAAGTELPSCPVCLERLDRDISGIITTVCNHVFHNECLVKWGDTSCPVCRYCMQKPSTSHCSNCDAEEDLWICLICGHVGCGRYRSRHAFDHWQDTQHCYALELNTQRVWDYAGDGYVHRLVRSKTDGKLVEVPAPGGESSGSLGNSRAQDTDGGKFDSEKDEAIVTSKLDAIAFEYNHLLTAQLESQRQYFEGLLCQARVEADSRMASICDAAKSRADEADIQTKECMRKCKGATKKLAESNAKMEKLREEKEFLRSLNENLIANQKEWQDKCKSSEERLAAMTAEKDACIRDLEEQVRDLMVFLETQRVVEGQGGELQGGSVISVAEPETPNTSRRGRRGSRGRNR
ncbi:hypothetical protein BSKO_00724 [Bryopsis sp. KO-2023]|nr:hypothetical protein BSKO_00724 [Bryopsis sp. KO-2023]